MIENPKKLNKNLENNWNLVNKIIFAFSVYVLFRVFVRTFDFDTLRPFSLIFVVAGFFVYNIDKYLPSIIAIFDFRHNPDTIHSINVKNIINCISLAVSFLSVFLYYILHYYSIATISLVSILMGPLIALFYTKISNQIYKKINTSIIAIEIALGTIAIIHSIVNNDMVNIYLFIFIVIFFILDALLSFSAKEIDTSSYSN